jgi:hypothetical protein
MGEAAAVKRFYSFSTAGLAPTAPEAAIPVVKKSLVRDVRADLKAPGRLCA